jgi:DNA-directed RNA polymerase subunit omega
MEIPQSIDSKYRFILISAKRARQLQAGAQPLIQVATKKPTRVAQLEVAANLVPFENFTPESSGNGDGKSGRK